MSPTEIPALRTKCCKRLSLAHLQTLRSWIHLHSYLHTHALGGPILFPRLVLVLEELEVPLEESIRSGISSSMSFRSFMKLLKFL